MLRPLFFLGFLFAITAVVLKIVLLLDFNKRVYNHSPGPCRQLDGIEYGGEDVALIEESGLAFISSGIFYMTERPAQVKGNIFLLELKKAKAEPKKLKLVGLPKPELFRPHGLSHFVLPGGGIRLFVVNHSPPDFKHSVIIFDFDEKEMALKHVRTVQDQKLVRPNDVVATGAEQFIFSNDGSAQTAVSNLLEIVFHLSAGSLGYFDGKKSHWLLEKTMSANGIALDRKKEHLYVSHINDEAIGVYSISKDFLKIQKIQEVPLLSSADNLYVAPDESIWTGAHPVMKDALAHLGNCEDLSVYAPSQVLHLRFTKADYSEWELTEPFINDGRLISGSSIAVVYGNQLLVGSVCREAIVCDIAHPAVL